MAIPEGMVVRHSCDNPPCVNPEHLLLGTQADNMADKINRGRANVPHGERHTSAKLTADDVRDIRQFLADGESCRSIGRAYGVSHQVVSDIKLGKSWRSVC